MKHTPGPWKAFRAHGTAWIADTRELTCLEDVHSSLVIEILNGENMEHDASLIAAAPELLEALITLELYARDLLLHIDGGKAERTFNLPKEITDAQAVIAKATEN